MNFLQLCQAVAEDSGTVAGVPNFTTVVGATGRVKQVVGWTRDAYIDVQNERDDWLWMRSDFEKALAIGQIEYTAAGWALTDVAAWLPDLPDEGWRNLSIYEVGLEEQESEIRQISYSAFRARYLRGTHDQQKPVEWAISPQNALLFGPTPDKAYVIKGEYRTTPVTLAADADTPLMPAQYHRVIVQEAMRLMSRSDEAFQVLAAQAQQYERLRQGLANNQTPPISFGGGTFA